MVDGLDEGKLDEGGPFFVTVWTRRSIEINRYFSKREIKGEAKEGRGLVHPDHVALKKQGSHLRCWNRELRTQHLERGESKGFFSNRTVNRGKSLHFLSLSRIPKGLPEGKRAW